jgi:DNA mismatch repair protein MutS2
MIYPVSFEEKTGFSQVRQFVSNYCISAMGRENVSRMSLSVSREDILHSLQQVSEFRHLLLFDDPFPARDFHDSRPVLQHLRVDGTYIELEALRLLRDFIQAIIQVFHYFQSREEKKNYPTLWALCETVVLEKELLSSINKILDPKGNLRDNASEELRRIRSEMIRVSSEADRRLRRLLQQVKQEGIVKEGTEMTVRDGRLCIPVPAMFKRKLPGFIHDESATGQTVFIEPTEVFDANNMLRDLQNAEKREIIRLLTVLSNEIRLSIPNLQAGHLFLGEIDFIRAKALWAVEINGIQPRLHPCPLIDWHEAKHPLLLLNAKHTGKTVVPLNLTLHEKQRIVIISGPNAGGKSVCLKTVGLLQYMLQCGLLVPMKDSSDMGIFTDFFIDIGDEQSIDNDLSTYSSHLLNLKNMLEHLNESSLFLIDEFGSGTEPALGGAMAEAILERIYELQAFGIITTHFGNLKAFPDHHTEAVNGAMLFDTHALKPLFSLKIGKAGSSFTYEIAQQTGLPPDIIANAIAKSGTAQIDYEKKLEEIELEKIELEKTLKNVHNADEELARIVQSYHEKYHLLDSQRKEILQKAKQQATAMIDNANKLIENTIREIRESEADAKRTRNARQELSLAKDRISRQEIPPSELPVPPAPSSQASKTSREDTGTGSPLQVGDAVLMPETQIIGEISHLKGNEVTLSFHSVTLRTTTDKLLKISKKEARAVQRGKAKIGDTSIGEVMNREAALFQQTLDLRGERATEALSKMETYIDKAIFLGIKQARILHGKGNGILRHVIREALSKRKEIREFHDESIERGGTGITVVKM